MGLSAALAYDGHKCTCTRCPNFLICHVWAPPWYYQCHGGVCVNCAMSGDRWEFRDTTEKCCVCSSNEMQAKFPKCLHWCCVSCMRNIMLWDETRYHLDPCKFGCPPCPNGCANPRRGTQCYCDEYEEIQDLWKAEKPLEYEHYLNEENNSIASGEDNGSAFYSKRCPICKTLQS